MRRRERGTRLTNEDLVDRLRCVLVDVLKPVLDILETLFVSDVVNQQNSHSISVMRRLFIVRFSGA